MTIIDHDSNGKKWIPIVGTFIGIIFFSIQVIKNIKEIPQHNNYDSSDLYFNLIFLTIWIGIGIYILLKKSFQSSLDISSIADIKQTSTIAEETPIVNLILSNNRIRKLYFVPNDDLSFIETVSKKIKKQPAG